MVPVGGRNPAGGFPDQDIEDKKDDPDEREDDQDKPEETVHAPLLRIAVHKPADDEEEGPPEEHHAPAKKGEPKPGFHVVMAIPEEVGEAVHGVVDDAVML